MSEKLIAKTKNGVSLLDSQTHHIVNGLSIPSFKQLKIVQLTGDTGFYLFYFDLEDTEITDTYHDSIGLALEQAKFEFGITSSDWEFENG